MMRSQILKAAGAVMALAIGVFGSAAPSLADGYGWRPRDLWQSNWRAVYLSGGLDGVVRTGSTDIRIGQAVLGKYPYHDYGYNNGACIGFEWVCDCWGNVIGRRPVMIC